MRLTDHPAPGPGEAIEIAPGILWARLRLPMKLDHVNIYALEDGDGWTVVDSGLDWPEARADWAALLAGPLAGRPIRRAILTHHHPDHVGLTAWLVGRGAQLWTTRMAWTLARMLVLDHHDRPTEARMRFLKRAGWSAARLAKTADEEPFNFSRIAGLPPEGYRRLRAGEVIGIGGRLWRTHLGEGHAPEQISLWSEDGALALTADQILPGISPNIGVNPSEPEADPLGGWLQSCAELRALAAPHPERLALPGHQKPFTGIASRLGALIRGHESALTRLETRLAQTPCTAVEIFPLLFGRKIGDGEYGLATAEAVAHLNYLRAQGRAVAEEDAQGALRFRAA